MRTRARDRTTTRGRTSNGAWFTIVDDRPTGLGWTSRLVGSEPWS